LHYFGYGERLSEALVFERFGKGHHPIVVLEHAVRKRQHLTSAFDRRY
jgi:hypothetical protein